MRSLDKSSTIDLKICDEVVVAKQKISIFKKIKKDGQFWILCLPAILLLIVFAYIPMYGVSLSFFDYSIRRGILGSEWVGLKWFMQFFNSVYFFRILRNTLLLNVFNIIFTFPLPIVFALLLNEIKNKAFKRTIQTISYMPHFISTVIVVGIMVNMFSATNGVINKILMNVGLLDKGINFFYDPKWFRPLYIGSEMWQHFGWNSIIYLAALSSIDTQLYEAAQIDGANSWKQLWYITLPGISTVTITLLILNLGSMMNVGFEKILLMYNPATYEASDVIATYTYREGIISGNLGYGTAVGLFNSIINLILIVFFNFISKKFSEVSIW